MALAQAHSSGRELKIKAMVSLSALLLAGLSLAHLHTFTSRAEGQGGCGPLSLSIVVTKLGKPTSPAKIYEIFGGEVADSSLWELSLVAKTLGVQCQGLQLEEVTLRTESRLGILAIDDNHFVALVGRSSTGYIIENPTQWYEAKREFWSVSELEARWNGQFLALALPKT